ncbi:MAG: hypothetical protein ACFCUQ_15050 [Kiloniellales bacterium]
MVLLSLGLLALSLFAAGCSPRPFVVDPPRAAKDATGAAARAVRAELGPHDYDPSPLPLSLCYSSQFNTREQVVARARELCPNNGEIRYYDEDALLNDCSLFQPVRVTFICSPGPPPPSPYN